jgi:hypothetical protein
MRPRIAAAAAIGFASLSFAPASALAGTVTGMDFFSLAPCRAVDTRQPNGPLGGPALVAGADRTFSLTGVCGVPSDAAAVSVNIAVTGATMTGNIRLHAGGTSVPLVASINYSAGQTRSNNAVVPLGPSGGLAAFLAAGGGTAHLIVDVNGFFRVNVPTTTTIYQVKAGGVAPGTFVELSGVVTAAKAGSGFFVQVPPDDPIYQGPESSGIFVFWTGTVPSPIDAVTVRGDVQVFEGETQIAASAAPTVTGFATLPSPVGVSAAADIATGGSLAQIYESVIVVVSGLTVIAQNPAVGEFTVNGNLIVDDFLFAITPLPAAGTAYTSLTGVLATRQNESKLLPRSGADVVP